ncbi:carbon storage regulator [Thioalkalivibrio sp. ALE23]|uniref:carbon storage regulator n=1 Tax=Thioalkalivibrio sp. ALE23 TaxID=1265495 RepID=UPI000360C36D|nr:carbon storage regulator [Thioalkalivibrio sp. ALE23]
MSYPDEKPSGLVLGRREGEGVQLWVGNTLIHVTLVSTNGRQARLRFEAGDEVEILRDEIAEQRRTEVSKN